MEFADDRVFAQGGESLPSWYLMTTSRRFVSLKYTSLGRVGEVVAQRRWDLLSLTCNSRVLHMDFDAGKLHGLNNVGDNLVLLLSVDLHARLAVPNDNGRAV